MGSLISRYKWLAVPLIFIVLLAVFSPLLLPQFMHDLSGSSDQAVATETPIISPSIDQFSSVGTIMHVCFDTPPLYSPALAHQAASAIATEIDSLLVPGFSGLRFYSSYIASKSYQDETGINFTIPPIPSWPARPVQQHSPDPYQDALLRDEYNSQVKAWQKQVNLQQLQLNELAGKVHSQTNKLRSLSNFPYDAKAADYYGCLSEGASHMQDATKSVKTKLIIFASALVNNVSTQELGSLTLSGGVEVKAVYFSCREAAVVCQARVATLRHLVMGSGAKSFTVLDVTESQLQQPLF